MDPRERRTSRPTTRTRPDGVVFFYGNGIGKRNTVEGMRIVDIAPTLLYYLGLPVGKDMDGIVQSPVFVGDFTAENPIFSISSYEEFRDPEADGPGPVERDRGRGS